MVSALLINDVPIECINEAAIHYNVPATLIISILQVEGGKTGSASKNTNGTFDYGPMQINTIWLDKLKPLGITKEEIQHNPCINVWVGTWILSQRIASSDEFWYGVASYHSYSLPKNTVYRHKVVNAFETLTAYLSNPGK